MGAETGRASEEDVPGRDLEVGRTGSVWGTAHSSELLEQQVGFGVRETGGIRP